VAAGRVGANTDWRSYAARWALSGINLPIHSRKRRSLTTGTLYDLARLACGEHNRPVTLGCRNHWLDRWRKELYATISAAPKFATSTNLTSAALA
jgi:hypothetical protein